MGRRKKETTDDGKVNEPKKRKKKAASVEATIDNSVIEESTVTEKDEPIVLEEQPSEMETVADAISEDASSQSDTLSIVDESENKPKEERKSFISMFKGWNFYDSWNGQLIDF